MTSAVSSMVKITWSFRHEIGAFFAVTSFEDDFTAGAGHIFSNRSEVCALSSGSTGEQECANRMGCAESRRRLPWFTGLRLSDAP